jgi:hypothetical protein
MSSEYIATQGNLVEIHLFDNGVIDGGEVRIIGNNAQIASGVVLKASPFIVNIPVIAGQVNRS